MPTFKLRDGRQLAYQEYGDPNGVGLFGFHGSPGAADNFAPLDKAAKSLGIRLIAPDRPGYGGSTWDPDRKLIDWPEDVKELAGDLGLDTYGVFGMSGGGPHAAVCGHALADSLIGCAIVSGVGPLATKEDSEGMMPPNKALSFLARKAPRLLIVPFTALGFATRKLPEATVLKQMLAPLPDADVAILTDRLDVRAALTDNLRSKHPTSAKAAAQDFELFAAPWGFNLTDITIPVHIWQGDADVNVPPAHARRYAAEIPTNTTHFSDNDGHMLIYDYASDVLSSAIGKL